MKPIFKPTKMNRTEQKFADYCENKRIMGDIVAWKYEPFNVRLADRCFYKVDFLVVFKDRFEVVEVKGCKAMIRDDALVKFKLAAKDFPWFTWRMVTHDKKKGWSVLYQI